MNVGSDDQRTLAQWAADVGDHVLAHFEDERPGDERPRRAIEERLRPVALPSDTRR